LISGGGIGPKSLDFIVRNCDGWMPIVGIPEWHQIKEGISKLVEQVDAVGRSPGSIDLSVFSWSLPDENMTNDMEQAGIKEIVISLEAKSREEVLPLLDEYASLIE